MVAARHERSCPVLVGRDDVLELLAERIADARSGVGRLLLLAGEAGVGKTRLVTTAQRRARSADCRTVQCAAFPRDLEVPAAALIDLSQQLIRDGDPVWADVGSRMDQRLRDLPSGAADAHSRRRRLALDVADLVAELATDPTVLAIEDVHWSDGLTLEVLAQLARRLPQLPLLVLVTYRSDELYPQVPMRQWRTRLLAQRVAEETRLSRLSRQQTETMVAAVRAAALPPPADLVDEVHQRSDGIPLHVEELLALHAGPGGALPDTLADAVIVRSDQLDRHARAVASAAAVIGRRFDLDLLADVLGEPAVRIDSALQALQDHFFVSPTTMPGSAGIVLDFRHALIRDVLYERIPPARRRVLHGRTADAAQRRGASAAFLSSHYELAGRTTEARRHALDAGRRASELGSHREALELFGRALRTEPADLPVREHADVLARYAAEAAATDANQLAADSYAEAARLLREAGAPIEAAALAPPLIAVRHLLGDDLPTRLAPLRSALEATQPPEPQADAGTPDLARVAARAQVLSGMAAAYMLDRQLEPSIEHGRAAVDLAQQAGDEATELDALVTLGSCLVFAGRMEEGWRLLTDSIERAAAANREAQAARAYRMISSCASVLVEYDLAERMLREGAAYAERVELWNHRHYMAAHLAHVLWAVGDWSAAESVATHAMADGLGGMTTRITCLHVLGYLALGRGDFTEAERTLGEARSLGESMGELQRLSPALWGLAEAHQLRGNDAEAIRLCRRARDASDAVGDAAYLFPFLVTGTRALIGAGDLHGAQSWVEEVSSALESRSIPGTLPAIDHARGLLDAAAGSTRAADVALERAEQAWAGRRRTWDHCRVLIDRAECALRAHREAVAVQLAAEAGAMATKLGAPPLQAAADRAAAVATARGGNIDPWSPLTSREFQVARLIAEGQTNREIAATLGISPRTAGSHVTHILTRLGAERRAEIAAWAVSVTRVHE